jgi:putative oxidoreductase
MSFAKGISFLNNMLALQLMIENSGLNSLNNSLWLAPIITWIHILGGTFIILGLFTRISILIQLPIVVGAIIFINSKSGVFAGQSDLIFSLFVLVLLILFIVEGAGQISMDSYVKKHLL